MRRTAPRAVLISGVRLDSDPLRVVAIIIDLPTAAPPGAGERLLTREREARREPRQPPIARWLRRATALVGGRLGGRSATSWWSRPSSVRRRGEALAFLEGDEVVVDPTGNRRVEMSPWRRFPFSFDYRSATR
jgi:hypothetical protein